MPQSGLCLTPQGNLFLPFLSGSGKPHKCTLALLKWELLLKSKLKFVSFGCWEASAAGLSCLAQMRACCTGRWLVGSDGAQLPAPDPRSFHSSGGLCSRVTVLILTFAISPTITANCWNSKSGAEALAVEQQGSCSSFASVSSHSHNRR